MINKPNAHNITFLLSYSSIFHLGAWRNSIELLIKKGYSVKLVQFEDEYINSIESELEKKYSLIQIKYPIFLKSLLYIFKYFFRSLKKIGLDKLATIGDGIDYLFKSFYFVFFALLKLRNEENEILIGGDPPSLLAAYLIAKKNKSKLVLWQLELLIEKELPNFGERYFKRIEKKCSKNIVCAIEFGEKRCELLRVENQINDSIPIFSIPNSCLGNPFLERNYYFNQKFNIPTDKKIVLFAGGIFADINELGTLWESFETWDDKFVLVVHSRVKTNVIRNFAIPEKIKKTGRFFFHDDPLSFDHLNKIYASCDIGLILIRLDGEINSNLYYSDLSLGKLFHFMYYGVPVITRNLYGYKELIENKDRGFCFNNSKEIGGLLMKILRNESKFKENSITFSNHFSFERHHLKLENFIETI